MRRAARGDWIILVRCMSTESARRPRLRWLNLSRLAPLAWHMAPDDSHYHFTHTVGIFKQD